MERCNIFGKRELLTKEDRKRPLVHGCDYFKFESNIDLSDGIKVIPYGSCEIFSTEQYSIDLMSFMVWWTNNVFQDLNGFSGMSNIKFEFVRFKLV